MKTWTKFALVALFLILVGFWLVPFFAGEKFINPIFFAFGGFTVYWYGFLITMAIILGTLLSIKYVNRFFGFDIDTMLTAVIWLIIGGMVGARLVFVILKWSFFAGDWIQILHYTQGGLSIHGAILGGLAALAIYAHMAKLPVLKFANLFIPAVVLGQAIGRFGNFFNQEAFGGPTDLPWKMFVSPEFRPETLQTVVFFHPTILYESIGLLIILVVLLSLLKRNPSVLFGWYLVLYSSLRFVIEFFRIDSDMWEMFTVAQWASIGIVIVGVWLIAKYKKS
jgi:phosphatidylglycerol:prolipoprotein diacylglycerol transferase